MAGLLAYKHWAYWLAAIIDGEGYICVDRKVWTNGQAYYTASVGVKNTHLGLLEQVQRVAGCGSIRSVHARPGTKPIWLWSASGPNAAQVLQAVQPLLLVKKEQARLSLALQETKLGPGYHRPADVADYQAQIYAQMKVLNRRGVSVLESNAAAPDT